MGCLENSRVIGLGRCMEKMVGEIIKKVGDVTEKVGVYTANQREKEKEKKRGPLWSTLLQFTVLAFSVLKKHASPVRRRKNLNRTS